MIDFNSTPAPERPINSKKLTAEKVANIKEALARGYRQQFIANHFGISQATVSQIARGVIWKDVASTGISENTDEDYARIASNLAGRKTR